LPDQSKEQDAVGSNPQAKCHTVNKSLKRRVFENGEFTKQNPPDTTCNDESEE
jgi:hypothetical protein